MRRPSILITLVAVAILLAAGSARADLITVQQVTPLTWDFIYTPGPANTAVGGFDIDVSFDWHVAVPTGLPGTCPPNLSSCFGAFLGDDANTFRFSANAGLGVFNVQEVSLLSNSELLGLQPSNGFLLFRLGFENNSPPPWNLNINVSRVELADGFGNPILENVVPEPGSMLLLGSGLAALARWRKKLI